MKLARVLCLCVVTGLAVVGCGGEKAKTLAQQNAELARANEALRNEVRELKGQLAERTKEIAEQVNANGVLQVKLLKVSQCSPEHACIEFHVTNNSTDFIGFWNIAADVYDSQGGFLAHEYTNGSNLRAGQTTTGKITFGGVVAKEIAKWKPTLKDVTTELEGGKRFDKTKQFSLALVD